MGQAGESLGARRGQRTPGSPAGLRCQLGRALQEGSGRGETATRLRTGGRQLELRGHVLVWCERGVGPMPGAAIGIDLRIGGSCKRLVRGSSLFGRRRAVDRRTQKWVAKGDPRAYLDQVVRLCGSRRLGRDAELVGRLPEQRRIADRLGRGYEH